MIGRKDEIQTIENCLLSKRPEFLAVYGRRRVGKTFLIKEFFDNSFSFYATGVQNVNNRQQLKLFKEALVKYGDETKTIPKDWFEAFSRLEKLLESDKVKREYKTGRIVVFLDELPWMDTARSDFKSALDYFWNSWGSSKKDLFLIVCGSATSWIIDNIVKDTGGFYNRLTARIRLMPFNLNECEKLLEDNGLKYSRKQIVESYMILGGIPYYLNYLKPQYSLTQNIEMLFFNENGPLKYEFTQLFNSLFKKSDAYIAIVKELSKNKSGMTRSQMTASGRVASGKELTKYLENLEQCGFIRKYRDYSSAQNNCHYQLIDPFCLFYMTFLEKEKVDSWIEFTNTSAYHTWCGLAFEKVCLWHTKQIKNALGIAGISSKELSWSSKKSKPGAQIDLLIDRKDDVINICEIKYSQEEFSIDAKYNKELIHKVETFRKETKSKKSLWLTMISFSGLYQNEYSSSVVNVLTGDDLFQ